VSAAPDTHGRKPISDHLVLNATRHVLHIGVAWEDLPQAYGCGSGVTVWRRLRDWQQAGVWLALHHTLLGQAQSRRRDRLVARRGRRQPCRALRIRARSTPARPQTTRQRLTTAGDPRLAAALPGAHRPARRTLVVLALLHRSDLRRVRLS